MQNEKQQCFNCGYFYDDGITYYSENFARYWSPSPIFSVNWCFHCTKVTTYKQVKAFGLFKIQAVKPDQVMTLPEFVYSPLGKQNDYERGKVASQFIKLIWHSLLEHQDEESQKDLRKQYPTFELALEKLTPEIVAYMLYILENYHLFADLQRQLLEGIYVAGHYSHQLISDWLKQSKHPNIDRINHILTEQRKNQ
jgi:hypothetical protein